MASASHIFASRVPQRDRRWAGLTHIRARAKCLANFDSLRALKSFVIDSSSRFGIGIELALAGCPSDDVQAAPEIPQTE